MNTILFLSTISIGLPTLIIFIIILTSSRSLNDREKLSPFECGFDPNHTARVPFSTRFFLLAIIFIVFDIEIVLLIPIPIIYIYNSTTILITAIFFLMILLLGLLHEWKQGSLDWTS
jgi:NADH-ubiquinone oxidoreductase chain 3